MIVAQLAIAPSLVKPLFAVKPFARTPGLNSDELLIPRFLQAVLSTEPECIAIIAISVSRQPARAMVVFPIATLPQRESVCLHV